MLHSRDEKWEDFPLGYALKQGKKAKKGFI